MRVYLDLDNTLLATRTFYNDYYKVLLKGSGSTEREIEASYRFFANGAHVKGELFTPKRQMEMLGWRESDKEEVLSKIENILREHRGFIFPEVVKVLHALRNKGATIVLLTFGHQEFQKQKIIASGIAHFFDEIIITSGNKIEILKEGLREDTKIFFVDDHKEYMR
jgi:FMN phosphatase YigB (HAD superfamily)